MPEIAGQPGGVTATAAAGLGDLAGVQDPRGLRADAPLLDAWLRATAAAAQGAFTPMTIPGHKQCQDLTGAVVAGDIPLYGGLAAIKHADVLVADAERRAARLWGADWCRFSVAGSTHGNQALALAVGAPGDEVIISRTLHRSLMLGLVLAGLRPAWVRPELDPASGLPLAVATGELVTAQTITALRAVLDNGGRIAYASDPTLTTLQVLTTHQYKLAPRQGERQIEAP